MINLICGPKGVGKTKEIIKLANASTEKALGCIVFITDKDGYTYHINYNTRFVNANEFFISSSIELIAFIKGLVAGNRDIEHFYIDGVHRMCRVNIDELETYFDDLEKVSNDYGVNFTLAISASNEELPGFLKKRLE